MKEAKYRTKPGISLEGQGDWIRLSREQDGPEETRVVATNQSVESSVDHDIEYGS